MTRRRVLELLDAFNVEVPNWLIAAGALFVLGILLGGGCAGPLVTSCHDAGDRPYTHERPTQPFQITVGNGMYNAWFSDGGPTVLTVHNPTSKRQLVHVVCEPSVPPTYIDFGHIEWFTCLEPHQEKWRLTEFMNIDAVSQVCHVAEAYEQRACVTVD